MNNIFKIIWNKTTQRIEVVSELAKGAVKASSGSHQSKSIAIKSTLKLSLLSLCLGFTNEAMALANIDGNTTFNAPKGGVLIQDGNGKYAVGVYDKASASFAFGYAQAGHKGPTPNEPAAVGNKQLAIGNDNITSSGHSSIAIGSNVGDNSPKYRFAPNDGTKFRKGGAQGMYTVAIGAGMQAIGRNVVAIGRESGNGGAYNGYDDAVYLGSYSRINPKGQGQADNINTSALENTYTTAVTNYNGQNNETNLNAIINAGRAINNVALNKVDKMTIKYNVNENSQLNTKEQDIKPVNASEDKTTVSILSIGGENGDNKMYRQIQNVAAGRMSADSFDAVNGSQLYYVRNYTGWNIGHNSNNQDTVTGRVNNDHTVIFKANDNYVNVSTTLDSTNKSTVNIGVNTSDISVTKNNERITAVAANNPTNTVATNTVATATSVKTALETFNDVKADKVDIMGYSHVNSNGNTRDEALLKADGTKATFNYEGRNNSSITNASDGKTKDNNGKYAEASGAQADRSIASGVYANAFAKDSIAIGTGANVNNYWGSQFSESINGIAIGKLAQVEGSAGAIAFGAGSTILRNLSYNVGSANAIAIGNNSKITAASGAIAIGNDTNITAIDTGVGNGAVNAIAIGNGATVERRNSIALGQGTKASAESSIALGNATKVSGTNTVAIGTSVTATKENTVAIGTNVTAAKENSVVIGQNASATMERVVAIGAYAKADGDRTVAIGPEATAGASRSIVIGGLGDDAKDNQAKSESGATQAIVIGNGAQAKAAASYSITLGNSAKTEAATGISIGDRAKVASGATSGIALGKSAVANKSGDIAIGESSSTSDKHTVSGLAIGNTTLSTGVAATDGGTVSFGNNTIKRQIQNVGAGEISETSSDVVTGSQLYYVIKAADEIAKTEYNFQVNGTNIKTMRNNGTSTANNANNVLNFKAGDGLDVTHEGNAVIYKLNADSKQAIADAKTAATTVTNKLQEINQSVTRAETAAGKAEKAKEGAEAAQGKAEKAKEAAETARDEANTAKNDAVTAKEGAEAAQGKAEKAKAAAETARDEANTAKNDAVTAKNDAVTAKEGAEAAKNDAVTAKTAAETAADKAKDSENTVKMIKDRIEGSGLISKDGKTAFAADNTSGRNSAKASGKDSTAMGYGSEAKGNHSTALGNNAKANKTRSTAIGHNAEAKASGSVALGEGSVAKEENTVSVGDIGHERRITNVQDPKNLTDAANKRYVDNSISSVRSELKQTDRKLRGGIAGAVAMANIPTVNRAGGTMVGIGVGSFKGQSAVAVGVNRASDSNRVHFKMSGSATTSGDYAVGAGMGYQW